METNFRDNVSGNLLYALARMVQKTCRYQVSGFENFEAAFASGRPVVGTGWHGNTMMLVPFATKYLDFRKFVVLSGRWSAASICILTRMVRMAHHM
jgi:lysophospholipid acyltransferase (LPLAT)-like uncharacterized protein